MTASMKGPSVRVAVIQASAVPFDSDACIDTAVRLIEEAAAMGAKVVVFPEAFMCPADRRNDWAKPRRLMAAMS